MAYRPGFPSVQGQQLEMTVVGCYKLTDKEWFSRQDPYVVIEYSGQKFRTRTDTDGGRNPSFNETFKFALIDGLREMTASVWNSNMIERDDYIGSTKILLGKVIDTGYDDTQWSLTNSRGKSSGVLKLILHYAGAKTNPATQATSFYGQPAPAYSHQSSGYGQQPAASPYGQPAPAYPPPLSSYGSAHYPPPPSPMSHPPPPAGYPPPASPQSYMPAPSAYPPQPSPYSAPPPASTPPSYYPQASASPYGSTPPTYPPTSAAYPGGYPQYRY